MYVAVGSTNPVKVQATERALARYDPSVASVAVDSGVSEQPTGQRETVTGAKTRARGALEATDADYGVGLEGGVARIDGTDGLFLIMWAAVTDGERDGLGSGPSLRLPTVVAERLEAGAELGPVMNELLGTTDVAETEGAAGALTDGLTDRTAGLATAVSCAAGPFVTSYYGE